MPATAYSRFWYRNTSLIWAVTVVTLLSGQHEGSGLSRTEPPFLVSLPPAFRFLVAPLSFSVMDGMADRCRPPENGVPGRGCHQPRDELVPLSGAWSRPARLFQMPNRPSGLAQLP